MSVRFTFPKRPQLPKGLRIIIITIMPASTSTQDWSGHIVGPPINICKTDYAASGPESHCLEATVWFKRHKPHLKRKFIVLPVYLGRI